MVLRRVSKISNNNFRTTIPQGFVISGTVDVQMTINCCKNSVSLINNLSGKYSMSKTPFCEISDLYTLLAR